MKDTLLLAFVIIQFNLAFSQKISIEIQGKKIGYFVDIEKKMKSELFNTNQTYLSMDDSAQPYIYKRKEREIPDLLVEYSFSKKDSIINQVLYEWDVSNFEKKDNNIKSEKFNKALIKKYEDLLKIITSKYGKSEIEGSLDNLKDIETSRGLKRNDSWKPNDSLTIEMYTAISNYYKKEGFVTVNPTHRIRLYVRNIRKKIEPKLNEGSITKSNLNFQSFIANLKDKNFVSAKSSFSDIIKENITENQLLELRELIHFDNNLVVFFKGFQVLMTGENYLMLQYKYENDESEIPKSIIKVIFDEDNKILGIEPMKMQ